MRVCVCEREGENGGARTCDGEGGGEGEAKQSAAELRVTCGGSLGGTSANSFHPHGIFLSGAKCPTGLASV